MAIVEELELDISGALDAIESLNQSLTELGTNLTDTLTTAIEAVDVTPLVDQLAALDASGLTTTIDAAIDESDGNVPIEADASAVTGEIDSSIDSADTSVIIEPEVGDIASEIESEVQSADATVVIEVDSSGIAEVESELGGLDQSLTQTTEGSDTLNSSVAALAGGDALGGLTGALGKAGPAGVAAATGLGVLTAGITTLIGAGTEALATQQRFNATFGEFRKQAESVNLGTLNTNLDDLAIKLGSDDEGLREAAASLFQFGKNADLTSESSLELTNNAAALAARAVALNPALGQVGDVANVISNAFVRGGKFASKYQLSLNKVDIAARAVENAQRGVGDGVSQASLALAGSQLAAEKYGDTIDKTINKGSKNAAIQQRSLNEQLQNFLEEAGKPLVAPFLEILKSSLPIVKALAPIFAEQGKTLLPAIADALVAATPLIVLFAKATTGLIKVTTPMIEQFSNFLNTILNIGSAFTSLLDIDVGGFFSGIGDAIKDIVPDFGELADSFRIGGRELVDDFFIGIKGDLVTGTKELGVEFLAFGVDLVDSFVTGITQEIGPALAGLGESFTIGARELVDDFLLGLQVAPEQIGGFVASVGASIRSGINELVDDFLIGGRELVGNFMIGVRQLIPQVDELFDSLLNIAAAPMAEFVDDFLIGGRQLLDYFLIGVRQVFPDVVAFFASVPGRLVDAVSTVQALFANVGRSIITGLRQGLTELLPNLLEFIRNKVVGAIKKIPFVGKLIGSPSPFFKDVGEAINEGLAQGISSSAALPVKALDGVVSAIQSAPLGLPAVAAALPSAGAAAGTAGPVTSAQADLQGAGAGINIQQLIVQTAAKDQTQVGIEVARQLRAESFRAGR